MSSKATKNSQAFTGIALFVIGLVIAFYKTFFLQDYWNTSRWEQLTGYPIHSIASVGLMLVGYFLIRRAER